MSTPIDRRSEKIDAAQPEFNYEQAFSRNIGWLTDWEQQTLREKRVAIAGMGGVGGIHLQTLTRLGIGRFSISDMDRFELANFNRQAAANMRTLGQPKVDAAAQMARDINPELELRIFPDGVSPDNLDAFLADVDLYVDSLDYFVFDIRRAVFKRCHELGIPAITAAPIGMGTGYLVFMPGGMSFEDYFRFAETGSPSLPVDFLLGLTPAMLHRPYLADGSRVDMVNGKGPSTPIACQLCAGVAGAEAVKILLKRGPVKAVPYYHHFDAYLGRYVVSQLPFGNKGPIQSLKRFLASRLVGRLSKNARPVEEGLPQGASVMDHVLDAARWAPSGDNSQPWRFKIRSPLKVDIQADLEAGNVYQYRQGEPHWLALGMLLEAMKLAAHKKGYELYWELAHEDHGSALVQVELKPTSAQPDSLLNWLRLRSVDRRAYRLRPLSDAQKTQMEDALGDGLSIEWRESVRDRVRFAGISAAGTAIRLRIRETFSVHRKVIDWSGPFSRIGLPAKASGLNPLLRPLMRWALGGHGRMRLLTQALKGRWLAQIDLDWVPGLCSAGYFVVRQNINSANKISNVERIIIGQRLLRFWLQATRSGLAIQPAIAPLCFAAYAQDGDNFTMDDAALKWAARLNEDMKKIAGDIDTVIFLGRIGHPKSLGQATRSLRRPLHNLIVEDARGSQADEAVVPHSDNATKALVTKA